jgi:fructose-specific phosphotransferase system IIA component
MKIEDILEPQCVKLPLTGQTKEEVIAELVDLLVKADLVESGKDLLHSAMEREGLMSTGIGKGVAIPHGRTKGVKRMCGAFGISQGKVDFGSLDGQPVQLFFFIATPQNIVADHVKALALVSRVLNREEIRDRLAKSGSAAQVLATLAESDKPEGK